MGFPHVDVAIPQIMGVLNKARRVQALGDTSWEGTLSKSSDGYLEVKDAPI